MTLRSGVSLVMKVSSSSLSSVSVGGGRAIATPTRPSGLESELPLVGIPVWKDMSGCDWLRRDCGRGVPRMWTTWERRMGVRFGL